MIETPDKPAQAENAAPGAKPTAEELGKLVERYTDNLMRAAFSLGFPDSEAEELVQATFCAFLDGGSRFKKRSQLLTYLFGILYNKAREARRYQGRHDSMDRTIDDNFNSHFTGIEGWEPDGHWNMESIEYFTEVEKKAHTTELGSMLEQCLEGLNAPMRMAFTLREVEGLDAPQICSSMGVTNTNLGVLLFRARNKLRDCLTGKGAVLL